MYFWKEWLRMKYRSKMHNTISAKKSHKFAARLLVIAIACAALVYTPSNTKASVQRLQNGSFEEGQTFTNADRTQIRQIILKTYRFRVKAMPKKNQIL